MYPDFELVSHKSSLTGSAVMVTRSFRDLFLEGVEHWKTPGGTSLACSGDKHSDGTAWHLHQRHASPWSVVSWQVRSCFAVLQGEASSVLPRSDELLLVALAKAERRRKTAEARYFGMLLALLDC